ncbi:MAG: hypothetical protein AB7G62_04730 [Magnetospirillum sp.]
MVVFELFERAILFGKENFAEIVGVIASLIAIFEYRHKIASFIKRRASPLSVSGIALITAAILMSSYTKLMKMDALSDLLYGTENGSAPTLDIALTINGGALFIGCIGLWHVALGMQSKKLTKIAVSSHILFTSGIALIALYISKKHLNIISSTMSAKSGPQFVVDILTILSNGRHIEYIGGTMLLSAVAAFLYWSLFELVRPRKGVTKLHFASINYASLFMAGAIMNIGTLFFIKSPYIFGVAIVAVILMCISLYIVTLIYHRRIAICAMRSGNLIWKLTLLFVVFKTRLTLISTAFIAHFLIFYTRIPTEVDEWPWMARWPFIGATGVVYFYIISIIAMHVYSISRLISSGLYCTIHSIAPKKELMQVAPEGDEPAMCDR